MAGSSSRPALGALKMLDLVDLEGLATRSVLDLAMKLQDDRGFSPSVLLERLNAGESQLVTGIASETEPHVHDASECALILKRLRYERERAALQRKSIGCSGKAAANRASDWRSRWSGNAS